MNVLYIIAAVLYVGGLFVCLPLFAFVHILEVGKADEVGRPPGFGNWLGVVLWSLAWPVFAAEALLRSFFTDDGP